MEFHPVANIFPMMGDEDYKTLVTDIARNGQLEPIWTYDGQIIDGRNRYKACMEIGVIPQFREWSGQGSLVAFVVSMNLARRHLSPSQKGVVALDTERALSEEAKKNQGRRTDLEEKQPNLLSILIKGSEQTEPIHAAKEAAKIVGVSVGYVIQAKQIERNAPDLLDEIRAGRMSIPEAKREIVKRDRTETPELPNDKYRIVYADPPWKYGNDGVINGDNYGHVARHYPSMTIQELCDLPVKDLVERDAVLFLWVTSPLLAECFAVIRAWGFEYKTSFVWDKVGHNFGHYNSVRHEFLLICTRGSCTPDNLQLFDSVQSIEKTRTHSQKPDEFRTIIDTLYTRGKRIELFARETVNGWEAWGNEPNVV